MAQETNEPIRLLEVEFRDGGVNFKELGTKTSLKAATKTDKKPDVLGLETTLSLSLDKFGSWIHCRWETTKGPREIWVPREHCKHVVPA